MGIPREGPLPPWWINFSWKELIFWENRILPSRLKISIFFFKNSENNTEDLKKSECAAHIDKAHAYFRNESSFPKKYFSVLKLQIQRTKEILIFPLYFL